MRRTKPSGRQPRRGVASFELVMSFPILMFLIAMLYTMYMATIMKSQLTMEVRHTAWLERSNPGKTASQPFSIPKAHSAGEKNKVLQRRVKVYANYIPKLGESVVPRNIKWGHSLLTGSWDHRQIEFKNRILIYPHLDVLTKMVTAQGGVAGNSGSVNNLNDLTGIPGL